MRVLLVNTNRMQPPVAPLALDYLGATLRWHGHQVDLLDLCLAADASAAVDRQLAAAEYQLIGLTFRNTDECYYPGREWFVDHLPALVARLRRGSDARLVLGGVGYSILPQAVLAASGADCGIGGEGEFALLALANGEPEPPGLMRRDSDTWRLVPPTPGDLAALPPMPRELVDNETYLRLGGQLGFETKRGCAAHCIYCADPLAKGRTVRLRPPAAVAAELAALASRDLNWLHTCDAEFNRPLEHALAVCEAILAAGLGDRLHWYAYCAPTPFPPELAQAMRRAGCVGINFGADSADPAQLRRLGRDFQPDDIAAAVAACRREGLATMLDLLLAGPGETAQTVQTSLAAMRAIAPDRVGLSVGLRVYPGTPLAALAARQPEALHAPGVADGDFVRPAFYFAPPLGLEVFPLIGGIVGDDPRFFFADPTAADRNYNYSGNDVLTGAIARGYRGAYWDILRRLQDGLPPQAPAGTP